MPSDWERVDADPVLRAALTRRYTGSGDALDALWWSEHPGEPTPAGVPDPGASAEAARRELFSRGGGSTTAEEVERAGTAAAADRDAARRALASADAQRTAPVIGTRAAAKHPSRSVLAGAVVAALAVGGVVGFAAGRSVGPGAPAALAVFDRAQRATDRPPSVADVPRSITRSSIRHLGDSSTTGVAVYAAEAPGERVCLLAIVLAARFTATCTTRSSFAAEGLSLALQATADPTDDSGVGTLQEVDPTWSPEGRLTF